VGLGQSILLKPFSCSSWLVLSFLMCFEGLSHATARDGYSGGSIRTITISADGVVKQTHDCDGLPFLITCDTVV
jgi:hypothetical protein